MKGLLRKMRPLSASPIPHDVDDAQYSFAMEYQGPPLTYALPQDPDCFYAFISTLKWVILVDFNFVNIYDFMIQSYLPQMTTSSMMCFRRI
ncbi:hypothetical protein ACHQM5_001316 [Ranunculus cassubicifolius]